VTKNERLNEAERRLKGIKVRSANMTQKLTSVSREEAIKITERARRIVSEGEVDEAIEAYEKTCEDMKCLKDRLSALRQKKARA
jgi:ubiquinone biosynthesis protein UbiJ